MSRTSKSVKSRTVLFNSTEKKSKFPPNLVRNQKYNVLTFLPLVLYEQFKFFFNLYFLLVALSQFVPALRIGTSSNPISRANAPDAVAIPRIPRHLCRAARICPGRDDREGGIRRL
jgi:magnesium-transporting ATPase (P-type)